MRRASLFPPLAARHLTLLPPTPPPRPQQPYAMATAGVQLPLSDVRSAQGSEVPLKSAR